MLDNKDYSFFVLLLFSMTIFSVLCMENSGFKKVVVSNVSGKSLQLRIKFNSTFDKRGRKIKDGTTLFEGCLADQESLDYNLSSLMTLTLRLGKYSEHFKSSDYGEGKLIRIKNSDALHKVKVIIGKCSLSQEYILLRHDIIEKMYPPPYFNFCSCCNKKFSTEDDVFVTSCAHGYHRACLALWSKKVNTCKVCSSLLSGPIEGCDYIKLTK